jgi:5-methylcytosine-specific restriction endonuclease McrA
MPNPAYGHRYQLERAILLRNNPRCSICGESGANSADHVPPLWKHRHVAGSGCCILRPAHLSCNIRKSGGWRAATKVRQRNRLLGKTGKR